MEVLRAVHFFAGDLYGSMIWNLKGDLAEVFNAWNICIKLAWNVPHSTHTYFLEPLLDFGISQDIFARYIKYHRSLRRSAYMEVRVLASIVTRDVRTVSGQDIRHIGRETDLYPWNCSRVQVNEAMCMKVRKVDEQDKWGLSAPIW